MPLPHALLQRAKLRTDRLRKAQSVTKRNATPRPVQNARIIRQELRLSILGFPLAANSQIAVPLESRKVRKVPSGAVVKLPSLVGARAGYLADGPLAGPLPRATPQPVPRTLRRCFVGPNGLVGLTAFSHQLGVGLRRWQGGRSGSGELVFGQPGVRHTGEGAYLTFVRICSII